MDQKLKDAIWYLNVLKEHYAVFQPEIRHAVDYAIKILIKKSVGE